MRVLEIGTTHSLAISGHHVAVLAAVIYFALRTFALPVTVRMCATLILIWHYLLAAGAPPPTSRAGDVATLVLAVRLFGRQVSPLHCTN